MPDDALSRMYQVTQSCLSCHDTCIEAISHHRLMPGAMRQTLIELLRVCADVCRTTAGAMVLPDLRAQELAHMCYQVCESCGHALYDVQGFSESANNCLGCASACRNFSSNEQRLGPSVPWQASPQVDAREYRH